MPQSFFIKQGLKHFGGDIVRAAYRGILRRQPLETEVKAHAAELAAHGQLRTVLGTIARSLEGWQKNLTAQPKELVRELAVGIFGYELSADVAERYERELASGATLAKLVASMSRDARSMGPSVLKLDARGLVDAAFVSLLGRPVDAESARGYVRTVVETGDVVGVLRQIGHSEEHVRHLVSFAGTPEGSLSLGAILWPIAAAANLHDKCDDDTEWMSAMIRGWTRLLREIGLLLKGHVLSQEELKELGPIPSTIVDVPKSFAEAVNRLLSDRNAKQRSTPTAPNEIPNSDRASATAIVSAAMRALLGKEPEQSSVDQHVDELLASNDLQRQIALISSSREHRDLVLREIARHRA